MFAGNNQLDNLITFLDFNKGNQTEKLKKLCQYYQLMKNLQLLDGL